MSEAKHKEVYVHTDTDEAKGELNITVKGLDWSSDEASTLSVVLGCQAVRDALQDALWRAWPQLKGQPLDSCLAALCEDLGVRDKPVAIEPKKRDDLN